MQNNKQGQSEIKMIIAKRVIAMKEARTLRNKNATKCGSGKCFAEERFLCCILINFIK